MKTKEIPIPAFLHDIHGEKSSLTDLILTYAGGVISFGTILLLHAQSGLQLSWWKLLLLGLVSADIGAGIVANFTRGTNIYYSGAQKRKTRTIFILTHFIHPALFFFALGTFSLISFLSVIFVIGSTLLINSLGKGEKQKVMAAFLTVTGISLLLITETSHPFLLWFFPLYMIKLFISFGIRRYA